MKKTLLFTLISIFAVLGIKAQEDIVLADYEAGSSHPDRTGAWNFDNLSLGIANPLKDGINGSDQVASINITSDWSDAVVVNNFDEPVSLGMYPFVKIKILSDTSTSRVANVTLKDINDYEQSIDFTLPGTALTEWTDAVFDFSSIAQSTPISFIKEMTIRVQYGTATGLYYFDDIRFTGPSLTISSSDTLTIFSETFSDNGWWLPITGGAPNNTTLGDLRTAQWGGSALSALAKHYTATDSFSIAMYNWGPACAYFYPASVRSTHSQLAIKDIGINGFQNLVISYNMKWTSAPVSWTDAPTVEYSLNGASWTTVTTSSTLPTALETWATEVSHELTSVTGDTLFVRMTNNTDGYCMVDDIKVNANPAFVTSIDVEAQGGTNAIDVDDAMKQMEATVLPAAAKQDVLWSLMNETGKASISATGQLTALKNGTVKVIARSLDMYGTVRDTQEVVLTNQLYPVTNISINGGDTIKTNDGTEDYEIILTPSDPDTATYTISLVDSSDSPVSINTAIIDGSRTLTPVRNGYVIIKVVANDYMKASAQKTVVIQNQIVEAEDIAVSGDNITTNGGTSQMTATVGPVDAENVDIIWSLSSAADSMKATISASGLVEAFGNGDITVVATDNYSSVQGTKTVSISGQVLVSIINITTEGSTMEITTNGGTLQAYAEVLPADARVKDVTWSVVSAGGGATISNTGLITAVSDGDVYVKATATDEGAYADSVTISITGQVPVTSVSILVDTARIEENDGTITLPVDVLPSNASDTSVVWSIVSNDNDTATINSGTGVITALRNGGITVRATSNLNASLYDEAVVIISNQVIEPTSINIAGTGNSSSIDVNDGSLQLLVNVAPADAVNSVNWSLSVDDSDTAVISNEGLVTAIRNGSVSVTAISTVDETISDVFDITITNQVTELTGLTIHGEGNVTEISTNAGTLQMLAVATPHDANSSVSWSIAAGDEALASINETGLLTAMANGTVTVIGQSTAVDSISAQVEIAVSGQIILVTGVSVSAEGGATGIDVKGATLQLSGTVTPENATDKSVTWATSDENIASVSQTGLVTAITDGTVTITVTAVDASGESGSLDLTISDQTVGIISNTVHSIDIYPNPVMDRLYIDNLENGSVIEIVNTSGQLVLKTKIYNHNNMLDVQNLKSGTYIIRSITKNTVYTSMLIKK